MGPSTEISSQLYGCFLSRGRKTRNGRVRRRRKVPAYFASYWRLPLPCALQATVHCAKSYDTTVTNRNAGNCDFDSLVTFAGGEWQFVAHHRAAIDRVTDLGIRRRGSARK